MQFTPSGSTAVPGNCGSGLSIQPIRSQQQAVHAHRVAGLELVGIGPPPGLRSSEPGIGLPADLLPCAPPPVPAPAAAAGPGPGRPVGALPGVTKAHPPHPFFSNALTSSSKERYWMRTPHLPGSRQPPALPGIVGGSGNRPPLRQGTAPADLPVSGCPSRL